LTTQAAGVVPIAHRSGGPLADIVRDGATGFLAATEGEFSAAMGRLLAMGGGEREAMQRAAMESAKRFSDEEFVKSALRALLPVLS
jgi:alpha-1,2-mannosyltransferase